MRLLKFAALVAAGTALLLAQLSIRPGGDVLLALLAFAIYAAMGGLIIFRHDGHLTGWLLSSLGLAILLADGIHWIPGLSEMFARWVSSWVWTTVFALFAALTLTFPTGHGPQGGSRWARLGRMTLWALPVLIVASALTETLGGSESGASTQNPIGFIPDWVGSASLFAVIAILIGSSISLVVKRRRARGIERAQLSWVVFGVTLLAAAVTLTFVYIAGSIALGAGDPGDPAWIVVFLVMILFPASFGVAVLRYRLFDIDRIVSRTVGYTLVVGTLAVIFAIIVTVLTSLLPAESDIAVAGSTLAVAALFTPLRRRIQDWVDRRFNRAQYDARRVSDRFGNLVRDEVDMDRIVEGWVDVISETMQPATIAIWLNGEAVATQT
ncbi:MAG TPA: hypothetical protein VI193_04950 [Acidimicrobiia bacterium]